MVMLIKALARKSRAGLAYSRGGAEAVKALLEMGVWERRAEKWGELRDDLLFEGFYTMSFGLAKSFYEGKNILDIGCGPRGSLEWASTARLSVGLDPLAQRYRRFGTASHKMQYVTATAEYLPFPSESFDVVSSIMSLKHMIGIHLAMDEIIRVMAPGGSLLIGTRVNNRPNRREPIRITRETFNKFLGQLKPLGGHYTNLDAETTIPLEHWISPDRPADMLHRGALLAHFIKE